MADYDASSLSSRYAVDAGERMRIGAREGYWLCNIKFPRPPVLSASREKSGRLKATRDIRAFPRLGFRLVGLLPQARFCAFAPSW